MRKRSILISFIILTLIGACARVPKPTEKLDINTYLEKADTELIYPTAAQIVLLKKVIWHPKVTGNRNSKTNP